MVTPMERLNDCLTRLAMVEDALREYCHLGAVLEPPFAVGDEVVVWETGQRDRISKESHYTPKWYLHGLGWFCDGELLPIPKKPPSTEEYDVGEYKRIDESDEGWIDRNGKLWWFDKIGSGLAPKDHWSDRGYRFPISRVPKAKFEKGQQVNVTWPKAHIKQGTVVEIDRYRTGTSQWRYRVRNDADMFWYNESDLEPVSKANKATRQKLPSKPPSYKGPEGEVEMRWVRGEDGEVLWGRQCRGKYWYGEHDRCVFEGYASMTHKHPLCEPVPLVEGWPEGTKWLLVTVDLQTRAVRGLNPSDAYHAPWTSGLVLNLTVAVDGFVIPDNIPIPESSERKAGA